MLETQANQVCEVIEILNELKETDVRTVPSFDSSRLEELFDSLELEISLLYISLPFEGTKEYEEHQDEVASWKKLVEQAESLLSEVRPKYFPEG